MTHPDSHLFVYGSLMYPSVWNLLIRRPVKQCRGRLPGYQRLKIRDDSYPVILPGQNAHDVTGVLYFKLTSQEINRLDRFEGDYYERISVDIFIDHSSCTPINAWTYRLKSAFRHLALPQTWDPQAFEKNDLNRFIQHYCGWNATVSD